MRSKVERALRWRFALGMCVVLSFCYGVVFQAAGDRGGGTVFGVLCGLLITALIVLSVAGSRRER